MESISEKEKAWDELARTRGYECGICEQPIRFEERKTYFARKLCSSCAYMVDQDD